MLDFDQRGIDLWTLQGGDIDSADYQVDVEKSPYVETHPNYVSVCQALFDRLGHDQVVWCSRTKPTFVNSARSMLYHLYVPSSKVLAWIDGDKWHSLINNGFETDCDIDDVFLDDASFKTPSVNSKAQLLLSAPVNPKFIVSQWPVREFQHISWKGMTPSFKLPYHER